MEARTLHLSTAAAAAAAPPPKPFQRQTHLFKSAPFLYNSQIYGVCCKRSLSPLMIACELKTTREKWERENKKNLAKKIVFFEGSPSLSDDGGGGGGGDRVATRNGRRIPANSEGNTPGSLKLLKKFSRRVLSVLSNLPLAIGEMATIAALMALAHDSFFGSCF